MLILKIAALLLSCQFTVSVETPLPEFTVSVDQPPVQAPKVSRRYLAMFTASWCGPCQRWKRDVKPQLEAAGITVVEYEMTLPRNVRKWGKKIPAFPSFAVIDWDTGAWLTGVTSGGIDLTAAKRMLDGSDSGTTKAAPVSQTLAPPVRFIQWPGWGEIDLETYNRDCNCDMCQSIRGMQAEYWRDKAAFEKAQTAVSPDQEGTPHELVETMLDEMRLDARVDVLGDLGCGDARILIAAARRGIRGIGVELDPERAEVARRAVKAAGLSHMIEIEVGDALEFDASRITAATVYLYPPLLAKLAPKLRRFRVVGSPYHEIPGLTMTQAGEVWIYRNGG